MNKNKILIISFVLFNIVFVLINTQTMSPKFLQSLREENYWVSKTHSNTKHDLVIVGDSRALRGIDPSYLTSFKRPLNFAYRSAGLSKSYILDALTRLDKGGILLIALTPATLFNKHLSNEHYYQYKNMAVDEIFLAKNLKLLMLFSRFEKDKFKKNKKHFFTKTFHSNGYVSTLPKRFSLDDGIKSYEKLFKSNKVNYNNLINTFKLLKDKKIKVKAFRMISCREMEQVENNLGKFDINKIKELASTYDVEWLDIPDRFIFKTYDSSHLVPKSAENFSKVLSRLL